jgi:hypothetical protein
MANSDNPGRGAEFERQVGAFFAKRGLVLMPCLDRGWQRAKREAPSLE